MQSLDRHNTAILFVDHQIGLYTGVRDMPVAELEHNVAALARAAKVLGIPVVSTTVGANSMWGPMVPALAKALDGYSTPIDRTLVNAWEDPRVVQAVRATARGNLIVAGCSLEVCAALPAMSAKHSGFDCYVAVDACGTFSQTKHETGLMRLCQAGVVVSDYATLIVEILKDNDCPEAGPVYAALDMPFSALVGQLAGALRQLP